MPHFNEPSKERVYNFIKEHPFATLIANGSDFPVATQIPVLIQELNDEIIIRGHIMRHTDHHEALTNSPNALITFNGPHCYVSSSWYSYNGEGATWNYMTVQAKGKVEFLNEDETKQILQELTDKYEKKQPKPQFMKDIPAHYVNKYVKAIEGFKMVVQKLEATFKLSQNRDDLSFKSIVHHLERINKPNELAVAKEMKKQKPDLF